MNEKNKLKEVYREALRLHKISWQKYKEGKAKWFWQKDTFDDSHLPEGYDDEEIWQNINKKIDSSVRPDNWIIGDGRFIVWLTFTEALILLIKLNYDNINYMKEFDIDLENYKLRAETFKIGII